MSLRLALKHRRCRTQRATNVEPALSPRPVVVARHQRLDRCGQLVDDEENLAATVCFKLRHTESSDMPSRSVG